MPAAPRLSRSVCRLSGKRYDPLFSEFDKTKAHHRENEGPRRRVPLPKHPAGRRHHARCTGEARRAPEAVQSEPEPLEARRPTTSTASSSALSLLTSTKLKQFDLSTADPKLRDRYDRTLFGASALLARRLVEAGVRFVNVTWDFPGDNSWDTHADNFNWLRGALPSLDLTYSALLDDLSSRGLLDETLVVLMSDACTPQVNGNAGRDH